MRLTALLLALAMPSLLPSHVASPRRTASLEALVAAAADGSPSVGTRRALDLGVPDRANGALSVRDVGSGVGLSARLVGVGALAARQTSRGVRFDGALGPGTTLLVRRTARGVEDFAGFAAAPAVERLTYRVTPTRGAGVRLVGRTLELLDARGAPRVRMAPPWLLDAGGHRIDVDVHVTGCALDHDPRAPFGRPVTRSGRVCDVELSWEGSGAAYPLVVDPTWSATDSLAVAEKEKMRFFQ